MPVVVALVGLLCAPSAGIALAADGQCRVVNMDMTPADDLQIVVWIEDADGTYVDTAFITRATGQFGLGNRPGMMEFNSGPGWCYGKRITTFPVWAHRHGLSWPTVIFQDEDEQDLSHSIAQSSLERTYCRPIRPDEALWDAETCATTAYSDKGKFDPGGSTSLYPPRADLTFDNTRDSADADMMATMNPFDAVSRPTPLGGEQYQVSWAIPDDLPDGDYVAWMEVSKEFDQNADYDYPSPTGIPWSEYGEAYRGQPSVVFKTPFHVGGEDESVSSILDYVGYGDPDGIDGDIRPPDATITSDVAGSGAGRLLITVDGSEMFRFRVRARSSSDEIAPGGAGQFESLDATTSSVDLRFLAPGDDDQTGTVNFYELRYIAGEEISEANWERAIVASSQITPLEAGSVQELTVDGLLPNTNYYFGIRAADECFNYGPIVSTTALTPPPESGSVDACFVATAAYGSLMANEVVALRSFRDRYLRTHATGEIAVESYYTFGPALAKLIQSSTLLRRTARAALAPAVESAARLMSSK
jgi:hypothetical protein